MISNVGSGTRLHRPRPPLPAGEGGRLAAGWVFAATWIPASRWRSEPIRQFRSIFGLSILCLVLLVEWKIYVPSTRNLLIRPGSTTGLIVANRLSGIGEEYGRTKSDRACLPQNHGACRRGPTPDTCRNQRSRKRTGRTKKAGAADLRLVRTGSRSWASGSIRAKDQLAHRAGQLPKEFKASDVRKVRGIGDKPSSEIFAALTRWIMAKAIKRKERGVYRRVG